MLRPEVDLAQLRAFLVLAEELHFGRAAARLGIAQPPFSQQIQRLERRVGCPLFARGRRVALTEAGRAMLEPARRAMERAAESVEAARRAGRGESGALTVGFPASVAAGALPAIVRAYREAYPGVELRLREANTAAQLDALRRAEIDVGFLREGEPEPGLVFAPLTREPLLAALSPDHALARRRAVEVAALADDDFVLFPREAGPAFYDRIVGLCAAAGFVPRIAQTTNEWRTAVRLVGAGLGVSILPLSAADRGCGATFHPLRPAADTTILLAWRRDLLSPTADAFLATARRIASSA